MAQESHVSFKLNIPASLKDKLAQAAERSGRSLTSEIITRLEASISLADDNGLDFTYEAFERMVLEIVARGTEDLERQVRNLQETVAGRDPYNRDD